MADKSNIFGVIQSKEKQSRGQRKVQLQYESNSDRFRIQTKQFPVTFALGDLKDFNSQYVEVLEDIRNKVEGEGIHLPKNDGKQYLADLAEVGEQAYNKLLPDNAQEYIASLETKASAQNRTLGLSFRIPPSLSLFWEMIYAGDTIDGEINPALFWGFRYPLGRTYWDIDEEEQFVSLQKGTFAAIHCELKESKREIEALSQHLEALSQRLETLYQGLELNLTSELLDDLVALESTFSDKELVKHFNSDDFRYGIVHFACHCENPEEVGASQAYLSLTFNKQELDMDLKSLLKYRKYGFRHMPFVFLNACGSSTLGHLLQTISFPTEFLNFGAAGVIATACTMPDNFASAFATKFYEHLLQKDEDKLDNPIYIGQALLETRRFFLENHNNPLGLAYGLYALSNQQLELKD